MELELVQTTTVSGAKFISVIKDGSIQKSFYITENNFDEQLQQATLLFEKLKAGIEEETIVLKSFKTTEDGKQVSQSL